MTMKMTMRKVAIVLLVALVPSVVSAQVTEIINGDGDGMGNMLDIPVRIAVDETRPVGPT